LVDAESISARIERLGPLLGELEQIGAAGHDAYMADFRSRLAAGHAIQLAVQICIDIGATGMRNILVHDYLKADDDEVWAAIGRLDDLREFAVFAQAQG
jgi:uncharacterized protein YutE (UPF0331/DUF86 family)